jgi:hypothetical protein
MIIKKCCKLAIIGLFGFEWSELVKLFRMEFNNIAFSLV